MQSTNYITLVFNDLCRRIGMSPWLVATLLVGWIALRTLADTAHEQTEEAGEQFRAAYEQYQLRTEYQESLDKPSSLIR